MDQEVATSLHYWYGGTVDSYFRQKKVGTGGGSKSGTVAGNVVTFVNQSDVQVFNGGDGVMVGGESGYVRQVNYDDKTILCAPVGSPFPSGVQTVAQTEVTPTIRGVASSLPTRTDGANGSMISSFNSGQVGWVFQAGSWSAF